MKKEIFALGLCLLLSIIPLAFASIDSGNRAGLYNESELAQSKLGNTIFIVFLVIALIALVIAYFLSSRPKSKQAQKNKKR